MTAQMHDIFIYKGSKYSFFPPYFPSIYNPEQHGMKPSEASTACWRGYICHYYIKNGFLHVKDLYVRLYDYKEGNDFIKIEAPIINGIIPSESDGGLKLFNNCYKSVDILIDYSGDLLIGTGFFSELYLHGGFQFPWKYAKLYQLTFEKGRFLNIMDKSKENAEERERRLKESENRFGGYTSEEIEELLKKDTK